MKNLDVLKASRGTIEKRNVTSRRRERGKEEHWVFSVIKCTVCTCESVIMKFYTYNIH